METLIKKIAEQYNIGEIFEIQGLYFIKTASGVKGIKATK